MLLELDRAWPLPTRTIGRLFVDGMFECYTCEDRVRPEGEPKVPHETAIPAGTYTVTIDLSQRFNREMPHILNVPGFSGIRIHSGNTEADTSGCILVGKERAPEGIFESRVAFEALFAKMDAVFRTTKPITITIDPIRSGP